MALNQSGSNSEGQCKKFYKKFSLSNTSHPNPQSQKAPIESDHPSASFSSHNNKNVTFFLPKMLSYRKEQRSSNKPCLDTAKTQVAIVNEKGKDQKAARSASGQEHDLPSGQVGNNVVRGAKPSVNISAAKTKSLKDEGKFSDYIGKVKDKMRTVSNVGSGKRTTRRDSFNDKVSHYIKRAKIKIRTTTNVGIHKDVSCND